LHDHVVIAGGGRVGQYVARVLQRLGLAFVVIELDQRRVDELNEAGIPMIYGDASHPVVLEAAEVERARLLLITVPAISITHAVVSHVRQSNPALHIVARAGGIEQMELLHELNIYEVVQPELEAGLEITRQALLHLDLSPTDIQRFTDGVREELYAPLYKTHDHYKTVAQLQSATRLIELTWVMLAPDSPLAGQTTGESDIRQQTGATVVSVMRAGDLLPNPDATFRFAPGDIVGVLGNRHQTAAFEQLADPSVGEGSAQAFEGRQA
ncbi:MAG: NAD-binding protein, partial [Ardenticatenaceae bacterium]